MKLLIPLLFVILLAVSTFIFPKHYQKLIEYDLTEKTTAAFDKEGFGDIKFDYEAHHVTLTGQVGSEADKAKLVAIADSIWGAYPNADGVMTSPMAHASLIAQESADKTITLRGVMPNEKLKTDIASAARGIEGVNEVVDEMTIGERTGVPAWNAAAPKMLIDVVTRADEAGLEINNDQLRIWGTVAEAGTKTALAGQAGDIPRGDASFDDQLKVVPWDPATLLVDRTGGQIIVTGRMPDKPTQTTALNTVKSAAGNLDVIDRTKIMPRTLPAWWAPHSKKYIPAFLGGSKGEAHVHYNANTLEARAKAPNAAGKSGLMELTGSLPDNRAADVQVAIASAPPANIVAKRNAEKIILTGTVKTADESAAIESGAKAALPNAEIVNQIKVAAGRAPAAWAGAIGPAFSPLFVNAKEPMLSMGPEGLQLDGVVDAPAKKTAIAGTAKKAVGPKVRFTDRVRVTAAPTPPPIDSELRNLAVYFNTASSWIKTEEMPKVIKAAQVIKAAGGNAGLTVGGYADLRGSAEANKKLSLERAGAVRAKLIELGVPADRLTVNHYGEDTSEVDPSELWKSRRVQIKLTK